MDFALKAGFALLLAGGLYESAVVKPAAAS